MRDGEINAQQCIHVTNHIRHDECIFVSLSCKGTILGYLVMSLVCTMPTTILSRHRFPVHQSSNACTDTRIAHFLRRKTCACAQASMKAKKCKIEVDAWRPRTSLHRVHPSP